MADLTRRDISIGTGMTTGDPDRYFYEPANGHGLSHDPLLSLVGPRPIGWIASLSASGVRNLAPYSFFNVISGRPPLLAFASGAMKDSVRNVAETGEFVWNLVSRKLAAAMNVTSAILPAEADEFEVAGLASAPSSLVAPPRVADAPVAMECRMTEIVRLKDVTGAATDSHLVIGQVVGVHIDRRLLGADGYDTAAARPVLRGGGPADYFEVLSAGRFQMVRPDAR